MKANAKTVCSFCGDGVCICDSCINVCKNILDKELRTSSLSPRDITKRLELLRDLREKKETPTRSVAKGKKLIGYI